VLSHVQQRLSVPVQAVADSDAGQACRECVTTAVEHAKIVLAAIIPNRVDLLDHALRELTPEQIPSRIHANLFALLERYCERTSAVMTREALTDLLSSRDAGTLAAYQEIYDELADRSASDADFKWSLDQVRQLAADRATNDALTEGMEILNRGVTTEKGEELRGHVDARTHVLARFADIDRSLAMQDSPEGELRGEGKEILAQYAAQEEANRNGMGRGIGFGIPVLDERVTLHRGELVLIVGYTSDGKTSLCVQLAWSAAVEQAKNVLFLTTETIRDQVRRRLIARHSCLPVFGAGDGLNSRDIKDGTLNDEEKQRFHAVVNDLDSNPGHGRIYLAQVPRGASMAQVESKIARVARTMQVDLVVMDYLALLKPERKRTTVREELSETLKSAKQITTTACDGLGVPFVSPWQVSRTARAEAESKGCYTLAGLSETAETGNSADTVIGMLAPLDNQDRMCAIKTQIMKHRDGEKANSIELRVDYATSKFTGAFQQGRHADILAEPVGALGNFW
jgi:replicative DNA helicase